MMTIELADMDDYEVVGLTDDELEEMYREWVGKISTRKEGERDE
jgi:hypothetical protein